MALVQKYHVLIKESHLDTFGHVNNAVYLQLFEEARWDWVTRNGYGLEKVHAEKKGPIILDVQIRFKRELKLRETICIETAIESYSKKICTLSHRMINEQGEVCCEAKFTCALFDLKERKLITPTPEWLKAIGLTTEGM